MNRLLALVRTSLRVNFGLSLLKSGHLFRHRRDWWIAPFLLLAMLGAVPAMIQYVRLIGFVHAALASIGQEAALLAIGILMGQLIIFVFGFLYVLSVFYFSRDLELLVPLPLTSTQVMLSKFILILVNEYLTAIPLVWPVLIVYGVKEHAGPGYWTGAALTYLLLPVLPLAIVGLLVFVLMRVANLGRNKDALVIVGSISMLAAVMAFQYWIGQLAAGKTDPDAIVRLVQAPDNLIQRVGTLFPPSIWATKALAHGGFAARATNAALFSGVSALAFVGLLHAARKLFYEGLIGLTDVAASRGSLAGARLERRVASGRRAVRAVFLRELRMMNRTPIFLINGVFVVVFIPIMLLVMGRAGSQDEGVARMIAWVQSDKPDLVILAAALFMTFGSSIGGAASSTYSREGAQFWISKVIPVAPSEQARGKFLHSLAVVGLGLAVGAVILLAALRLKPLLLLPALALAVLAGAVMTALGMMIDLARPLLEWTDPQKAIKQNFNVLLALLVDLGLVFGLIALTRALGTWGVTGSGRIALLGGLLAAAAWLSFWLLLKFADRRLPRIEV